MNNAQDRQNKNRKRSQEERSIMKYSPGLTHDTKPLSFSSGNRGKMLLKGHLSINNHNKHNKVIRVNGVDWGCIVHGLDTI